MLNTLKPVVLEGGIVSPVKPAFVLKLKDPHFVNALKFKTPTILSSCILRDTTSVSLLVLSVTVFVEPLG